MDTESGHIEGLGDPDRLVKFRTRGREKDMFKEAARHAGQNLSAWCRTELRKLAKKQILDATGKEADG